MSTETLDLVIGWVSFALTLFIFSYLLADNFLYRLAVHVLVGITAAYVAIVAVEGVIIPWTEATITADVGLGVRIFGIIPFIFGLFLIFKSSKRLAPLGNIGVAFIIGVGSAVALVGAILGTIVPFVQSTGESVDDYQTLNAVLIIVGTVSTLVYFQYQGKRRVDGSIKRRLPVRVLAGIGSVFIALTLGAIYAGIIITSLSVFSGVIAEQLIFLVE